MNATPGAPGLTNWIILIVLGAIWGSAFMAMELALRGFAPLWVAALRTGIAAPVMLAIAAFAGQGIGHVARARAWGHVAPAGVVGVVLPFVFLTWGQQHVPSAFAGVAMGSVPIVLVPLAYVFLRDEKVTALRVLGLMIGFAGLVVLVGPGALDAGTGDNVLLGRLACLGAAMGYAIASVLTRRCPPVPPMAFTAGTLAVAAAILLPVALLVEGVPQGFSRGALAAAVYAALFPTALAFYLRVLVINSAGSLFMSLVSYVVPLFAVLFGVVLLGEELRPELYIAMTLILGGIAVSQSAGLQRLVRGRT